MICAVASGKGGTGKTFISSTMATAWKGELTLFDCDVEEPNARLFLKAETESVEEIGSEHPYLSDSHCNGCGRCASLCRFNAIMHSKGKKPLFFTELCHSCGTCMTLCPEKAIGRFVETSGTLETAHRGTMKILTGRLKTGNPLAAPLIKKILKKLDRTEENIIDCPPGTSCPFIAAVSPADYVILVTEETPFGLHDMQIAAEVLEILRKPFGIVVNKTENRVFHELNDFINKKKIEVLGRIPWSLETAQCLSRGELPEEKYSDTFAEIHLKAREDFQRKRGASL